MWVDDGSPVDVICLDFQKAFDKVPHQRLIIKLKSHGMGNCIINAIEQWLILPPSHRMRGATAVLVRDEPQWHRHDRRSSAVVSSLIVVAPPKTVKTAYLRGGTAETFNMFRHASAVLPPSHRRRGATAVLVQHKPQWHRHDRRGSAVIPSLVAVAPPKTIKTADLRGGTAETFNIFKNSAVSSRVGPIRNGVAAAPP